MSSRDVAPPARRLLLQYLEPSDAVSTGEPRVFADHLGTALSALPVTDLALGWRLSREVIAAVRPIVPQEVTVWRWVPVLIDSGEGHDTDARVAVGPSGRPPPPFAGSSDFRFLCPDHDPVVEAGMARAIGLAAEVDAAGVLLDRIRWHSPSRSPATELTCFCERSREAASADGLDLTDVADTLASMADMLAGRRSIVAALLGGPANAGIAAYLAWRSERISRVVTRLVEGLHDAGLRAALDVFTPALAPSVGQDLRAIGRLGTWSKSMTYLDAIGPAAMPYELQGYAHWLTEAGDDDPAGFLGDLLGFEPPGLATAGLGTRTLEVEMRRLRESVGASRAIVGIDAVEMPGACEVSDAHLRARVEAVAASGLGLAPSWELLHISGERLRLIATALQTPATHVGGAGPASIGGQL